MERAHNLLNELFIHTVPTAMLSLPGALAALARDTVDGFPALRPHQMPAWHMFLVQLAALALHGAGRTDIPDDEEVWCGLLRGLTADYPADEPWCLAVEDRSKPAFLQPPVPAGAKLENPVPTPDALDLLITSRNHDLKQAVAQAGAPEDWLFALVSLQTGEGYGGAGNHGVARMNGGSSSRVLLGLAPMKDASQRDMAPRPGAWFHRDLRCLLETREDVLDFCGIDYADRGGIGLTWLAPWPEDAQMRTRQLDIWFIEACRRVRLAARDGRLTGLRGTSKAARIDAKQASGVLCDPWAPVHKTESKSLTLGEEGDFDYARLTDLLFGGDWELPLLARPASFEKPNPENKGAPLLLAAAALARGNSKTGGFRCRFVPLSTTVSEALRTAEKRERLHELAKEQVQAIGGFDKALSYALVLAIAGGDRVKIKRDSYMHARAPRAHLDRFADGIFFNHLWRRFDAWEAGDTARQQGEWQDFVGMLWKRTQVIFWQFLPTMPCAALYRHRAEARAESALIASVRKSHPELFQNTTQNTAQKTEREDEHAA